MTQRFRIAVVGGGISGLAAAWALHRQFGSHVDLSVLEASSQWGGLIQSRKREGFVLESGPDSLVRHKPAAIQLCRQLGLEDQLLTSSADHRGALVWSDGKLHPFPASLLMRAPVDLSALAQCQLLTPAARARVMAEPDVPRGDGGDESVAQFIRRRLGREVAEKLAAPLISGIYGAPADQIGIRSGLPELYRCELETGRLSGSVQDVQRTATSEPPFVTLKTGMGAIVEALVASLSGSCRLLPDTPVSALNRDGGGFRITLESGASVAAEAIVLALPSINSARLLEAQWPEVGKTLGEIRYSAAVIGNLAFDGDVTSQFTGSGILFAESPQLSLAACTWMHHKFSCRCPPRHSLIRCFIGGPGAREALAASDGQLLDTMQRDLEFTLGIRASPRFAEISRWPQALPIFSPGHHQLCDKVMNLLPEGLFVAGNFLDGIGISDCVRHGRRVAEQMKKLVVL